MTKILTFTRHHPVGFVILLTILWVVLLLILIGAAPVVFHRPIGDSFTISIGRLVVTACVLIILGRLGWLKDSGTFKLGELQVWLITLVGLLYFASASLWAFLGKVTFEFSGLLHQPEAQAVVLTHFITALSEEVMFRGLVLFSLTRAWGKTDFGTLWSVLLTSGLFALLHVSQVFTSGTSINSSLILVLQTILISLWWGGLVVKGGSIWPAVLFHFVGNVVVALQSLIMPLVAPVTLAYTRLLWFSLPLGLFTIVWLVKRKKGMGGD
jgi:membrane protease YdiL (CAAX protease family)